MNLADIRKVELVTGDPKGQVWVADVSAAPAALAPVPATRLPQVNLGTARVAEGNPPSGKKHATRTANLPFTITGTVTQPGQLKVVTVGEQPGAVRKFTVDVAPGATSGVIPVQYDADRLDDDKLPFSVQVWPTKGLATDDYLGRLVVVDDDPDAKLKVSAPKKVREGQPIKITVRLTKPSDDWFAQMELTRPPGRSLTGADVPLSWLKKLVPEPNPKLPLWQQGIFVFRDVKEGRFTATFVIPTRADGRREGPENVSFRIRTSRGNAKVTVTVTAR